VGAEGSIAFRATSPVTELAGIRIDAGGSAMRMSATLLRLGAMAFDLSALFLSFPNLSDSAALPWIMASPMAVARMSLGQTSEWHLSAGLLHVVASGKALGALQTDGSASALVTDPAIQGQLWDTAGIGASTRLATGVTLRAEVSVVFRGGSLAAQGWAGGAPVVFTVGAVGL
jgi:hypothetical protein